MSNKKIEEKEGIVLIFIDLLEKAKEKLKSKNMDLIVMNNITQKGAGFDVDTNIVTIIDRKGEATDYPLMKKSEIADIILDRMLEVNPVRKLHF